MKIFVTVLFLLIALIAITLNASVPDLATLCPYNNFCSSKATKRPERDSCCQKCSCDKMCYTVGTCCPDFDLNATERLDSPLYECVHPNTLLQSGKQSNPSNVLYGQYYRIIDSCPDSNLSAQFPQCQSPELLSDRLLVSGTENGLVYKNKHCAACHMVRETVDWRMEIYSCEEIMTMSFASKRDRDVYVYENCKLDARPPKKIDVDLAKCYPKLSVYGKCNATGKWDVFDQSIEEKCANIGNSTIYNTIYYQGNLNPRYFTNIYCYICNIRSGEHNVLTPPVCNKTEPDYKGGTISFSAILDIRSTETQSDTFQSICPSTHIWDKFVEVCRPLYCSLGNMPLHGKCVGLLSSSYGFVLKFYMALEFHKGNLGHFDQNKWDNLTKGIEKHLQNNCGLCSMVFLKANQTRLFIETILHTTATCNTQQMLGSIAILLRSGDIHFSFIYQRTMINITLNVALDIPGNLELIFPYITTWQTCNFPFRLQLEHLQICERFIIPWHELIDLGFDNTSLESSTDLDVVYNESPDTISICVVKYFAHFRSETNVVKWSKSFTFILLFIVLYM